MIRGYDDYTFESYNEQLTKSLIEFRNVRIAKELLYEDKTIIVVVFAVSLVGLMVSTILAWYFESKRIGKTIVYMLYMIGLILGCIFLVRIPSIIINSKALFIITIEDCLWVVIFGIGMFIYALSSELILKLKRSGSAADKLVSELEKSKDGLITIIIPTYNGEKYVEKAIESALNQTYKNTEIIVVNDGSSSNDKTDEIVKKYEGRVQYYKKINGGVSSALNIGLEHAQGKFINWLSHDDMLTKTSLKERLKAYCEEIDNKEKLIEFIIAWAASSLVITSTSSFLFTEYIKLSSSIFPKISGNLKIV